jgi:hypothetical protein
MKREREREREGTIQEEIALLVKFSLICDEEVYKV